jgi:hypothetical protein
MGGTMITNTDEVVMEVMMPPELKQAIEDTAAQLGKDVNKLVVVALIKAFLKGGE